MITLIMTGGNGHRLWPFTDAEHSKPFLKVSGDSSILQDTYRRALAITQDENKVFVATRQTLASRVKDHLPSLQEKNIVIEPFVRDTAPALAFNLAYLASLNCNPQEALVMLPGDNHISEPRRYCSAIRSAAYYVEEHPQYTILCGQLPTRADTSFGYIKGGEIVTSWSKCNLQHISRFVEKPPLEVARDLIDSGNAWWSVGVYIWQIGHLKNLFANYTPQLSNAIDRLSRLLRKNDTQKKQAELFSSLSSISVDYALTENQELHDMLVLTGDYGWNDFGSWDEWARFFEKHQYEKNVSQSDCQDNFVLSDGSVEIKLINIQDCIVIVTNKKVLVSRKGCSQQVKDTT